MNLPAETLDQVLFALTLFVLTMLAFFVFDTRRK